MVSEEIVNTNWNCMVLFVISNFAVNFRDKAQINKAWSPFFARKETRDRGLIILCSISVVFYVSFIKVKRTKKKQNKTKQKNKTKKQKKKKQDKTN